VEPNSVRGTPADRFASLAVFSMTLLFKPSTKTGFQIRSKKRGPAEGFSQAMTSRCPPSRILVHEVNGWPVDYGNAGRKASPSSCRGCHSSQGDNLRSRQRPLPAKAVAPIGWAEPGSLRRISRRIFPADFGRISVQPEDDFFHSKSWGNPLFSAMPFEKNLRGILGVRAHRLSVGIPGKTRDL